MKFLNLNVFFYNFLNFNNNKYKNIFIFKKKFIFLYKYKVLNYKKFFVKKDVNFNYLNKFLNVSMKSGRKETCLINFNNFLIKFYTIFLNYNVNYSNYKYYSTIYNLLILKKEYYNFNILMHKFISIYNSLFSVNLKKLNKNLRLKYKKTHVQEIIYIKPENRLKVTLKLINIFSFKYKSKLLSQRLFLFFLFFFLDPQKSYIWQRRNNIYSQVLKNFLKKN